MKQQSSNPKPSKFIGFGATGGTKPYKLLGFGAMDGTKPYKFMRFNTQETISNSNALLHRATSVGSNGRRSDCLTARVGWTYSPKAAGKVDNYSQHRDMQDRVRIEWRSDKRLSPSLFIYIYMYICISLCFSICIYTCIFIFLPLALSLSPFRSPLRVLLTLYL